MLRIITFFLTLAVATAAAAQSEAEQQKQKKGARGINNTFAIGYTPAATRVQRPDVSNRATDLRTAKRNTATAVSRASRATAAPRTVSTFQQFLQKLRAATDSGRTPRQALRTAGSEAFYAGVLPVTGWLEGTGTPLIAAQARKQPLAFRFSQPDADGHWQQVEALAFGRPTTAHGITSPLTDCYAATPEARSWQEQLATVTNWKLTAAPDGQLAVVRAYTAEGGLVYTLHTTAATDGTASRVCFFTDSRGLMADVSPDTLYTYGSAYRVMTDRLGRDSLVTFLDAQGYLKPRPDGVWQLRYTYSGLQIASETALDMAACPMNRRVASGQQPFCTRSFTPVSDISPIMALPGSLSIIRYADKDGRAVRIPASRPARLRHNR